MFYVAPCKDSLLESFIHYVILHCHIYIVSNHLPKECILYTYSFLIHITCVLQRSNRLATNVLSNKSKV